MFVLDATGLRLGRPRPLVLLLARAEPLLDIILPRATRATGILGRALGARGAARAHALRDGGRARDVGPRGAHVRRRARGRTHGRAAHRPSARRHQCLGRVSGTPRAGRSARRCGRV